MKTNSKKINTITVGLLGIVFLFTVSMANAALVHLDPLDQTVTSGDPIIMRVMGSGFDLGVSIGAVQVNWDPAIMIFDSATAGAGLLTFLSSSTPGSGILDYSAGTFAGVGLGGAEFTFGNLDFIALAAGTTNVGVGPSVIGGPWFDAQEPLAQEVTDVAYGAAVTVTVVNPVPVPGAVWLLGSGLLGLVGVVRRRAA